MSSTLVYLSHCSIFLIALFCIVCSWVISDWMRESERGGEIWIVFGTDFWWRKATIKFSRKRKQLGNMLEACNCRQGWKIRKREGWQDKKRIYLLARRWSRISQHSRSRSCSNVRIKRGHWNLLLNRSPVLCFLIALDSLLSLFLYPPSPQTWLALPSSSMLSFLFLQVCMKKNNRLAVSCLFCVVCHSCASVHRGSSVLSLIVVRLVIANVTVATTIGAYRSKSC